MISWNIEMLSYISLIYQCLTLLLNWYLILWQQIKKSKYEKQINEDNLKLYSSIDKIYKQSQEM